MKLDTVPALTRRIDLNIGYACNIRCRFCYYLEENLQIGIPLFFLSTEDCKKLIRFHSVCGMEIIDFTGGEPTIRQDLPELVSYAKNKGFKKVCVITNGYKLANKKYCNQLVKAGVSEFLFSIHSSNATTHDFITQKDGSFDRLLKAMQNVMEFGARVRCNSVVTSENCSDIYARAKLLTELGVKTLNYILFNPLEKAANKDSFVKYSVAGENFKPMIESFADSFEKLTIRYIPFCQMKGFENYVQNVHQVHYDQDEWNYYQRAYIREPHSKWYAGVMIGLLLLPKTKFWLKLGWNQVKHIAIMEANSFLQKKKTRVCKQCSNNFICGGVWKKYEHFFGSQELSAYNGEQNLMPWHYMNENQQAIRLNSIGGN